MKVETIRGPGAVVSIAVIDVDPLARDWWVVLLRGVASIIFGMITFFAPGHFARRARARLRRVRFCRRRPRDRKRNPMTRRERPLVGAPRRDWWAFAAGIVTLVWSEIGTSPCST